MNYNLNISDLSKDLLPPDKRKTNMLSLLNSFMSGVQYAHDYLFGAYYDDLKERIQFNGTKLILEYAINKQFLTTFRQPNGVSDIHISDPQSSVLDGFLIGSTEPHCSGIGNTEAVSDYIGYNWTFVYLNHFIVYVPSATLITYPAIIIRGFIDKYIPASLKYTIQSV